MKRWLRKIRGAVGMGLAWAVGWFGVGAVVGTGTAIWLGGPIYGIAGSLAFGWARWGFVGGVLFSGILSVTERRRSLADLSSARLTLWGALGGLLIAIPAVVSVGFTPFSLIPGSIAVLLGAISARGTLALARRAEAHDELTATEVAEGQLAAGAEASG